MNVQDALDIVARKERRQPAQDTIDRLDALSRTRALTDAESRQLYNAIQVMRREPQVERTYRQWTPSMDRRLINLRAQGKSFSEIGKALGMSRGAVNARLIRLKAKGVVA